MKDTNHSTRLNPIKKENNSIVEVVELLKRIDTNSKEAKLNISTISDNNGGRIVL